MFSGPLRCCWNFMLGTLGNEGIWILLLVPLNCIHFRYHHSEMLATEVTATNVIVLEIAAHTSSAVFELINIRCLAIMKSTLWSWKNRVGWTKYRLDMSINSSEMKSNGFLGGWGTFNWSAWDLNKRRWLWISIKEVMCCVIRLKCELSLLECGTSDETGFIAKMNPKQLGFMEIWSSILKCLITIQ